ncbi:MAG: sugar-transfer associated ATP-grasp domain-containing protein [Candidatus Omnitrophota bacterium]
MSLPADTKVDLGFSPCSPLFLPWFHFPDDGSPVHRLHKLAFACQWQRRQKLKLVIKAVLWPVQAALEAARNVKEHGELIRQAHGLSPLAQWCRMVYLANVYNISPNSFYDYRLFEDQNFKKASLFIQTWEMDALYPQLFKGVDNGIIDEKTVFLRQCAQRGLPAPSITAVFSGSGQVDWLEGRPDDLPLCDLFIKFTSESCGTGAEAWVYDSAARVWRRDLQAWDQAEFINYCCERSVKDQRPVLLQRRLVNSPEIVAFSTGALCTFRVITYLTPDGKAALFAAGLKMPIGKTDVDNVSYLGGIAAGVDLEEGVLRTARGTKYGATLMEVHPDTKARIAGHRLACWQEIVSISKKAQESFSGFWSVGWDIAMTKDGPVIIEGNTYYGYDLLQLMVQQPLGETVFPSLCLKAMGK